MAWYVKYKNGVEVDRKPVGRGRPPAGYEKIDDDDNIMSISHAVPESIKSTASLPKVDTGIIGSTLNEPMVGDIKIEFPDAKVIRSTKQSTIEDIKELSNYIRIEEINDHVIKMTACDFEVNDSGKKIENIVDYLRTGMVVSRLDIDKSTGNIYIWKVKPSGDPDIIIESAIVENVSI